MPDVSPFFPVLDAPRTDADAELGRIVLDRFGFVEPHVPELDWWCAMPLRLVYDQAGDVHLEIGPYSMSECDIEALRTALRAYDRHTGRETP